MRKEYGQEKMEQLLEQPGDLTVVATIRLMRKNRQIFVEVESDEGISRRVLKKALRWASLEVPL